MKTKKELREEFKQKKYRMGVFKLTNTQNGKIFIGSSIDLDAYWHALRLQLNTGLFLNKELQEEWKALGQEAFTYETLEEIKQDDEKDTDYPKEIKALEEMLIEELQPFNEKGYNKIKK